MAGPGTPLATGEAVRAVGLTLAHGRHVALRDATFDIPVGAVSALIGPNGSGKSTLLDAVAGLLPVSSGRLEVLGGPPAGARRRVAYVLQATEVGEHLPITVADAVRMGRWPTLGLTRRTGVTDRAAIDEAMARLGVEALADRQFTELSGGQRQRVLIAQGLAQQADLLLLDEPVTGLDVVSRQRILDVIDEERSQGRTVVLTTHDLDEAALADQVLLLAGRVVAAGPPHEVLVPDVLRAAYGGRVLVVPGQGTLLVDDPHHHSHGHDHTVCADDDELS
jgi:manganese transport system ATP-binding protein